MKKLKLSELDLGNAEVLSREELKKVLGGAEHQGQIELETWTCKCTNGTTEKCTVAVGPDGSNSINFDDCCGYTGAGQSSHSDINSCW